MHRTVAIMCLLDRLQELNSPYRTMIEVIVKSLVEASLSSSSQNQMPPVAMGAPGPPLTSRRRKLSEPPSRVPSSILELREDGPVGGASISPTHKEASHRSLRQQRSVSTGILEKSTPAFSMSYSDSGAHRKTSTEWEPSSPSGNPITSSVDADDWASGITTSSGLLTTAGADKTGLDDTKPHLYASRRSSHPTTRKEQSSLSQGLPPGATGVQVEGRGRVGGGDGEGEGRGGEGGGGGGGGEGREGRGEGDRGRGERRRGGGGGEGRGRLGRGELGGIRATAAAARHSKFKPRSFAELEANLEVGEEETAASIHHGQSHTQNQRRTTDRAKKFSLDERMLSSSSNATPGFSAAITSADEHGDLSPGVAMGMPAKTKGMRSFHSSGSLRQPLGRTTTGSAEVEVNK